MRYFYWAWLIIWFITWTGTTWMGVQAGGSVAFLFMMSAFGLGVLFFYLCRKIQTEDAFYSMAAFSRDYHHSFYFT